MKAKSWIIGTLSFVSVSSAQAGYGGYLDRGEYTSGRAVQEEFLCGGYIRNADTVRLKPRAQRDAASACRSGRARRVSDWDINCINSYLVVSADFHCL